jgi:hypothetical protein
MELLFMREFVPRFYRYVSYHLECKETVLLLKDCFDNRINWKGH